MARLRYSANERRVLAVTGVAHLATHFFELMFPTLAVALVRETGRPLAEVLGWSFAGYLLFGVGALPAGLLADRFGGRRVLVGGLLGMGLAATLASWASPGPSLALLLAAIGLCGSVYHPAGMSLLSHTVRARGRALGLNGICGNIGIALTPAVTAGLAARLGWQRTYLVVGLVTCGVALACALLPIDERSPHVGSAPAGTDGRRGGVLFALLCVAAACGGISYRANTVAQPAYFAAHVGALDYGTTTSIVYLLGIGGQYLGGVLADRHDLGRLYLGFHLASLPALLLMSRTTDLPLVGSAALFLFFSLGMQPIENSLFARFSPARWRATGYGVKFAMTFGVGSLAVGLVQRAEAGGDLADVFRWIALVIGVLVLAVLALLRVNAGRPMRNVVPASAAIT
jgi:FSR family fosmidomycin resistance protein-like MFS transporter